MILRPARNTLMALAFATPALAQAAAPNLSRTERTILQAVVSAVDAAANQPDTAGIDWQTHVLRASDGSHYVAFTIVPLAPLPAKGRTTLYVRLATRSQPGSLPVAERSAVMEWLRGMRGDPRVSQKPRGIAFGEMPTFGAGSIAARGPGPQDLALLQMERDRAREKQEARDRERKAALEGTGTSRARDAVYPFEDFAVNAVIGGADASALRRSLTAGPGDYDVSVAWSTSDPRERQPTIQVVKRAIHLPAASTSEFGLSSVVLADQVATRETAYPPDQQSAHPYSLGAIEIEPARDNILTNDERLTLFFQVINARANAEGKPDVAIAFQLLRVTPAGEQPAGSFNPLFYNPTTVPADFDLNKGHPVFAAMTAPLTTLARGDYRVKILANDRNGGRGVTGETTFRIVATPQTLLAAAPLAGPFRHESALDPLVLRQVLTRFRPESASAALGAALDAAGQGRFLDLLRDDAVDPPEQGVRTALRGIGLYAVGDARLACTLIRRAAQLSAPDAPAQVFLGACRALEGSDADAIAAWEAAAKGGIDAALLAPLLIDAHLRQRSVARAEDVARSANAAAAASPAVARAVAAVHLAAGREPDAMALIDARLAADPNDADAQFLLLRALFGSWVRGGAARAMEGTDRFRSIGRAYIEAKGRNASLVAEWLEMIGR